MTSTTPQSRQIVGRTIAEGDLRLLTPAHFGNGEAGDDVDLPLARHPVDGRPVLRGDSITGAMRQWLHDFEFGFGGHRHGKSLALGDELFGGTPGDPAGEQSPLNV